MQSVSSFDAGLSDGTLSGAVEFTASWVQGRKLFRHLPSAWTMLRQSTWYTLSTKVISGLSNTFYSSPTLNSHEIARLCDTSWVRGGRLREFLKKDPQTIPKENPIILL